MEDKDIVLCLLLAGLVICHAYDFFSVSKQIREMSHDDENNS